MKENKLLFILFINQYILCAFAVLSDTSWGLQRLPVELTHDKISIDTEEDKFLTWQYRERYPPIFRVFQPLEVSEEVLLDKKKEIDNYDVSETDSEWDERDTEWFIFGEKNGNNQFFNSFDVYKEFLYSTDSAVITIERLPTLELTRELPVHGNNGLVIVPGKIKVSFYGKDIGLTFHEIKKIELNLKQIQQNIPSRNIFNTTKFPNLKTKFTCKNLEKISNSQFDCYISFENEFKEWPFTNLQEGDEIFIEDLEKRENFFHRDAYEIFSNILTQYAKPDNFEIIPKTPSVKVNLPNMMNIFPNGRHIESMLVTQTRAGRHLIWSEFQSNRLVSIKLHDKQDAFLPNIETFSETTLFRNTRAKFISQLTSPGSVSNLYLQNVFVFLNETEQQPTLVFVDVDHSDFSKKAIILTIELNNTFGFEDLLVVPEEDDNGLTVYISNGFGPMTEVYLRYSILTRQQCSEKKLKSRVSIWHHRTIETVEPKDFNFVGALEVFTMTEGETFALAHDTENRTISCFSLLEGSPVLMFLELHNIVHVTKMKLRKEDGKSILYVSELLNGVYRMEVVDPELTESYDSGKLFDPILRQWLAIPRKRNSGYVNFMKHIKSVVVF